MNMRNGIPIVQTVTNFKKPQDKVWREVKNPYKHYIELAMTVDGCEASIVMPYKRKWVKQYLAEGWTILKEWTTDAVN